MACTWGGAGARNAFEHVTTLQQIQWSGYRLAIVVPARLPRLTDATSAKSHSVLDAVAMHAHVAIQKIDKQAYVIAGAMNVWSG